MSRMQGGGVMTTTQIQDLMNELLDREAHYLDASERYEDNPNLHHYLQGKRFAMVEIFEIIEEMMQ